MTAATTMFNTVIAPAARRRRKSSYSTRGHDSIFDRKAELVWEYDKNRDLLVGINSRTDERFCEIVAYYKVGMYPAAHMFDSNYLDNLGYADRIFPEEADAAGFGDELLAEMGVENRMTLAIREYSSSSFEYADESHPEDSYIMLTVGAAELWIGGEIVGKWEDDVCTEAFQQAKGTARQRFEQEAAHRGPDWF